jgi:ADP-ribose pyrophosphatase YjhB (NUDIX family)
VVIVGQSGDGRRLTEFDLGHGDDPGAQLALRGLRTVRPLRAAGSDGDLTVTMLVEPGTDRGNGASSDPARDAERRSPTPNASGNGSGDGRAVRRQRVAAYAWVESTRGILAAEFYRPVPGGRWGLPGGGLDENEEPVDAVHREVMEETSQRIELGELVGVDSRHWVGRSPAGVLEDFHAVRLIYRARCPVPTDPVVIDVGGTTTAATWFPYESWQDQPWNTGWRDLLVSLFG